MGKGTYISQHYQFRSSFTKVEKAYIDVLSSAAARHMHAFLFPVFCSTSHAFTAHLSKLGAQTIARFLMCMLVSPLLVASLDKWRIRYSRVLNTDEGGKKTACVMHHFIN